MKTFGKNTELNFSCFMPEKFQKALKGEGLLEFTSEKNKGDVKKHE